MFLIISEIYLFLFRTHVTYNVNANTGVSSLNGTPFQVQIGLRYGF